MFRENIQIKRIFLDNSKEKNEVKVFLDSHGLNLEEDVEYTIGIYENEKLVGTGSLSGRVLKSIAVDSNYQAEGLSNKIVSHLVNEQYYLGNTHLFIYTKPQNVNMFKNMGFYEIAQVEDEVALLENNPKGISNYLDKLSNYEKDGDIISSIVMNCNPFTLGHQYLIEKASRNSDFVHVFLVWEDRSIFPSEIRFKLIEEGTNHLSNVMIHKGEDYIISQSTFPSYFLKDSAKVVKAHALLDLKIFGEYIVPVLGINQRYVGEEPYCMVTKEYNESMKEILPAYGVEVIEIKRLQNKNAVISASKVRELIKKDEFEALKEILPSVTYEYLGSHESKSIINRIKNSK